MLCERLAKANSKNHCIRYVLRSRSCRRKNMTYTGPRPKATPRGERTWGAGKSGTVHEPSCLKRKETGRVAPGIAPWRSHRSVRAQLTHTARSIAVSHAAARAVGVAVTAG